jgi:LysR family nitrogen assimilation transcriptional regulator
MLDYFPDVTTSRREAREKALGLRELRYFLSVAQTGNIGRAAVALNVSQPAISMQLSKLEESLGTQLLMRHGRGVTLTAAGVCLRDRASIAMQLLSLPLTPTTTPDDAPKTITFAVTAEMGVDIGPSLAKAFRERWPDSRLVIREGQGSMLEEWIIHRHADVAILEDPPAFVDLQLAPVLRDSLGIVGPVCSNIGQDPQPLPVRELVRYPLILPGKQHWLRRRLDQATLQRGVRLSPLLEVDSVSVISTLVCSGLGFSVLPSSSIRDEVTRGNLAFQAIGQPVLTCNTSIAFHRHALGPRISEFADLVRYVVIMLLKHGVWQGARLMSPVSIAADQKCRTLRSVCHSDDWVRTSLRAGHPASRGATVRFNQWEQKSDHRVDHPTEHRSIPMGRGTALHHP